MLRNVSGTYNVMHDEAHSNALMPTEETSCLVSKVKAKRNELERVEG